MKPLKNATREAELVQAAEYLTLVRVRNALELKALRMEIAFWQRYDEFFVPK